MKNMIIFLLLLCGCMQGQPFSGVYIRHVESEYSVGEDTVFISHADGHYTMDRHTGFQRIKNGVPAAREIKLQHAVLNPAGDWQWEDPKTGVIISYRDGKFLLGTAAYDKIK